MLRVVLALALSNPSFESETMLGLDSGKFDSRAVQHDSWIYVSGDGFGRIVEVRCGFLLYTLVEDR